VVRIAAALIGLTALAMIASCSVDERSGAFRCAAPTDCDIGRTCENGWCVAPAGAIDASAIDTMVAIDAPPFVCPSSCTTCVDQTCIMRCDTASSCTSQVVCPAGVACRVECSGMDSCGGGVDCTTATACEVVCNAELSCGGAITCGAGPCKVDCAARDACASNINCNASCRCDVTCSGQRSCAGVEDCPFSVNCELAPGCTSAPGACDRC
jgi:hypothetical protein